jgi:hypothetical protein
MDAFVEVIRQDGSSERFPIEGQQATLGRSGTAGISLPTEAYLEMEHLLLAPRGREGCWVSISQGAATPVTFKGKPFSNGMVKWGAELAVGSIKLRVTNKRATVKKEGQVSPVIIIAAVLVLAGAAFMLTRDQGAGVPSSEGLEPPELFTTAQTCPAGGSGSQVEQEADSRGDRYPYDPRDGVAAVQLYGQAASCYTAAGSASDSQRVASAGATLQATVDADYASRRLRLGRALSNDRFADALREANALLRLTQHLTDNDYVAWLTNMQRIVEARAIKQASKRAKARR